MEINKSELLKLLNELDNHNVHTCPDHDFPEKLRDKIHDYIDCLEKSGVSEDGSSESAALTLHGVINSNKIIDISYNHDKEYILTFENDIPKIGYIDGGYSIQELIEFIKCADLAE